MLEDARVVRDLLHIHREVKFKRGPIDTVLSTALCRVVSPVWRDVDTVATTVFRLERLAPFRVECLESAWVLTRSLRRCGHDANVVIGVSSRSPISFHAWSAIGSMPVGQSEYFLAGFEELNV